MASTANLFIDQGTDFSVMITLKDQDGNVMDLTIPDEVIIRAQFRKSYQSSTAVNFTTSIIDAASGIIELSLLPDTTSEIRPGRYVYDVELTSLYLNEELEPISSQKVRVIEGIVVLTPEVTQT